MTPSVWWVASPTLLLMLAALFLAVAWASYRAWRDW